MSFGRTEGRPQEASVKPNDAEPNKGASNDYWEKYKACETITRKVLTARRLVELAGGYDEAQTLLDTVVVAMGGKQGNEQVAKVRRAAAGHHEILAAVARAEEGK